MILRASRCADTRQSRTRHVDSADTAARVRDLAKGLIAAFERDPKIVGPLMRDYEWLAALIVDRLDQVLDSSALRVEHAERLGLAAAARCWPGAVAGLREEAHESRRAQR